MESTPEWGYAAALAQLPRITPRRLRRMLDARPASQNWTEIIDGSFNDAWCTVELRDMWRRCDPALPAISVERCSDVGVRVLTRDDPMFPPQLRDDISPPAVLFVKGNLAALEHRRVAIVGTRTSTQFGRHFARELARDLSLSGVAVVSGLARGIDVHAHKGVSEASALGVPWGPPVAVVASGIDVVYPPENSSVWRWVAEHGAIFSEYAPGTAPLVHHFPQRNRIVAAFSEVLVVVESAAKGGSMITVREAAQRDIPVMAVPGSPHVRASAGTNALLRDGCAPVTDAVDVLVALDLEPVNSLGRRDTREAPHGLDATVLSALLAEPLTIDSIVGVVNESPMTVAVSLGRLQHSGWVEEASGWWEALTVR